MSPLPKQREPDYIGGEVSRICKAYEARFRALLARAGAREVEKAILWFRRQAQMIMIRESKTAGEASRQVFESTARRTPFVKQKPRMIPTSFLCDAGLGGLARWLRGAGIEAVWEANIEDDALVRKAQTLGATILTTDSMLMERRLLRDQAIPAYWLPPTLGIPDQLLLVFREFGLVPGKSRCMACGGELVAAEKETLRDRIPPRTFAWLNEFFVCRRCDRPFWHGTHYHRIQERLNQISRIRDIPDGGCERLH